MSTIENDPRRTGHAGALAAPPRLVSVSDAARALAVSSRSVWRWIAMGELTTVKFGRAVRIPYEQVERLAREGVPL